MLSVEFIPKIREARVAAGLSQQALAQAVGVSRQALSALEAGRSMPGTDVALRLARALHCRVEALFVEREAPQRLQVRLEADAATQPAQRVRLTQNRGAWTASPLDARGPEGLQPADGLIVQRHGDVAEVEWLGDMATADERLIVMGCAPALGLLAARLSGGGARRVPVAWRHGSSTRALDALERGDVHVAGIHLRDAKSGRYNVPQVERRFAARRMVIVNFASWAQGLVVAKGNPLGIRAVEDVLRPRIRLVQREPGAGANRLLEQLLKPTTGVPRTRPPALVASGHLEVAQAIAYGAADVGVAIESVALAWGLDFIPLSAERFDLVFPRERSSDERVERLIDELGGGAFRRELQSLGGYGTSETGHVSEAATP